MLHQHPLTAGEAAFAMVKVTSCCFNMQVITDRGDACASDSHLKATMDLPLFNLWNLPLPPLFIFSRVKPDEFKQLNRGFLLHELHSYVLKVHEGRLTVLFSMCPYTCSFMKPFRRHICSMSHQFTLGIK